MPKKKADPIATILDYFESAPKESCEQALTLAKRAMGKRFSPTTPAKRTKATTRPTAAVGPADQPAHHGN